LLSIAHFGEAILLADQLRGRKISHLHNHFANSGATVGLLASQHAGISWSFTIHGISEFDYPAGLLLPDKIAAATFVACVSYFGRAQAARVVDPRQWPKLTVVRCGIEIEKLPPRGPNTGEHVRLIFVGRLSAEKGVAGLLEALSLMPSETNCTLTIVGDGPLRADLERQCVALGLRHRVAFLGRLPETETLAEIARSEVLVLPSFMEGLPIVLMEALALGVPVVASRVAGVPELVADGQTGLLFAASNWQELAGALDQLVNSPELRGRMAANGPPRIAEKFDVRASAVMLRDLFPAAVPSDATPLAPHV
jgi:glycosyltransferase involved in cell wall biosynthesis